MRPYYFRGKARILSRIVQRNGIARARVNGVTFTELDLSDHIQWHVYCGLYEIDESRLVKQYIRRGMTIVDVGANIGYYTSLASRYVGAAGRVLAIEPSPYAYRKLRQLVTENHLHNVSTFPVALADVPGTAELRLEFESRNHAPTMLYVANSTATPVGVTTLDRVAQENGIRTIDLLKLDVEGYEPKVLAGASTLLASGSIRAILCEFNRRWLQTAGTSPETFWNSLIEQGFEDCTKRPPVGPLETRFLRLRTPSRL